jgi:hypothetical protein
VPSKLKKYSEASSFLPSVTTRAVVLSDDDLFETEALYRSTAFLTGGLPSKVVDRERFWISDNMVRCASFSRRHLDAAKRA